MEIENNKIDNKISCFLKFLKFLIKNKNAIKFNIPLKKSAIKEGFIIYNIFIQNIKFNIKFIFCK